VQLGGQVAGQLVTAVRDVLVVFRLGCCGEVCGGLTRDDCDGGVASLLDAPDGSFGVGMP
jgi:hypothetical protein